MFITYIITILSFDLYIDVLYDIYALIDEQFV